MKIDFYVLLFCMCRDFLELLEPQFLWAVDAFAVTQPAASNNFWVTIAKPNVE